MSSNLRTTKKKKKKKKKSPTEWKKIFASHVSHLYLEYIKKNLTIQKLKNNPILKWTRAGYGGPPL
jgi:hypothetical protein